MPKKVFINYAPAPEAHKLRVAELVASLRAAGLSIFDQDVTAPVEPPEDWFYWNDQLEQADWVLVVCNEVYYRWFRGEEPGLCRGKFVDRIIRQALDEYGIRKQKLFLVLLGDDETPAHIPSPFREGPTTIACPPIYPNLRAC
jgi:hypothetical protein